MDGRLQQAIQGALLHRNIKAAGRNICEYSICVMQLSVCVSEHPFHLHKFISHDSDEVKYPVLHTALEWAIC